MQTLDVNMTPRRFLQVALGAAVALVCVNLARKAFALRAINAHEVIQAKVQGDAISRAVRNGAAASPGALRSLGVCNSSQPTALLAAIAAEYDVAAWAARDTSTVKQWNFFHIPKTAGTSLARTIMNSARNCGIDICEATKKRDADVNCVGSNHPLVRGHQYHGLVPHARARGLGSSYFTVLRHPVARVASLYHYIQRSKGHPNHAQIANMTLKDFAQGRSEAWNEITRRLCGPKVGPLHDRCAADKDFAVGQAKRHLYDDFSVVGLQECYPESVALIASALPWVRNAGGLEVLHANDHVTDHKKAVREPAADDGPLDEDTMNAILARNSWDLELFEFGLAFFRASLVQPSGSSSVVLRRVVQMPVQMPGPTDNQSCDRTRPTAWSLLKKKKEHQDKMKKPESEGGVKGE